MEDPILGKPRNPENHGRLVAQLDTPSGTVSKPAWMESRMQLKFWMNPPRITNVTKSADNYPESVFILKSSKNTISGLAVQAWRCT